MKDKKNELKIDGIYTARDLYTDVMDLYAGKTFKQYSVGFKDLDPYFEDTKTKFQHIHWNAKLRQEFTNTGYHDEIS